MYEEKFTLDASQESAKVMPNGYRYFHFYTLISPGKHDISTKLVKDGEGYDSIEEALEKETSLLSADSNTLIKMKSWVNQDFMKGFGVDYPEYKVIAWVGPDNTHKPLVYYTYEGKKKWVTHPQINLMVQRYQTTKEN